MKRNSSKVNEDKKEHLKEVTNLKRQLNESFDNLSQFKNELHNEKQLRQALESELSTLQSDLAKCKDDSSKLVIQQNDNQNLSKKLNQLDERLQSAKDESIRTANELKLSHLKQIDDYEIKLKQLNDELAKSKEFKCRNCDLSSAKELNDNFKNDESFKNQSNNSDNTDLDSLDNTSINLKQKRLSTSTAPDLDYVNPLQEILNASNSKTVKAELLDQLNELLKDSESNNSLLTEQNRLLKEEVRRLERSIERTEIAKNLEYFKNILIKFLSFENNTSDGSERTQLVPVLKTILKLSKEEEIKLKDFTKFVQDAKQFSQQQSNEQKSNWFTWNGFSS